MARLRRGLRPGSQNQISTSFISQKTKLSFISKAIQKQFIICKIYKSGSVTSNYGALEVSLITFSRVDDLFRLLLIGCGFRLRLLLRLPVRLPVRLLVATYFAT